MTFGYLGGLYLLLRAVSTQGADQWLSLLIAAVLGIVAAIKWPQAVLTFQRVFIGDRSTRAKITTDKAPVPGASSPTPAVHGAVWADRSSSFAAACLASRFLQGLFGGSTGVGGWPVMLFVLLYEPDRDEFRATQATLHTVFQLFSVPLMIWLGVLDLAAQWPLLLSCVAGQVIGSALGSALKVGHDVWLLLVFAVMLCACVSLGLPAAQALLLP